MHVHCFISSKFFYFFTSSGRAALAIERGFFNDFSISDPSKFTFNEESFASYLREGDLSLDELTKMIVYELFQFDLISKDIPVVFVGFSFGCILSYECARSLEINHGILVSNLISICGIPFEYYKERRIFAMADENASPEENSSLFIEQQEEFFGVKKNYPYLQQPKKVLHRVPHMCKAYLEILDLGKMIDFSLYLVFLFSFFYFLFRNLIFSTLFMR